MPASCSAYGCTARFNKSQDPTRSFHRFPKDDALKREWVRMMKRENFTPTKYAMLCSKHFREEDIDRTSHSVVRIRNGAVPCIFALFPPSEKPHVCKICGKSFSQLGTLRTHSLNHNEGNPHVCKICGKSFTTTSILKTHSLIHSGEKPHVCKICGKSFTQKSSLKTHFSTHSVEKPNLCNICGRSFCQKEHLKRHSLYHNGGSSSYAEKISRSLKSSDSTEKDKLASETFHMEDVNKERLSGSLVPSEGKDDATSDLCKRESLISCSTTAENSNTSYFIDISKIKEEEFCCDEIIKEEYDLDYEEAMCYDIKKESDSEREKVTPASETFHMENYNEEKLNESLVSSKGKDDQCKRESLLSSSTTAENSNTIYFIDKTIIKEEEFCCDEIIKKEHDLDYEEAMCYDIKNKSGSEREEKELHNIQDDEAGLYTREQRAGQIDTPDVYASFF